MRRLSKGFKGLITSDSKAVAHMHLVSAQPRILVLQVLLTRGRCAFQAMLVSLEVVVSSTELLARMRFVVFSVCALSEQVEV